MNVFFCAIFFSFLFSPGGDRGERAAVFTVVVFFGINNVFESLGTDVNFVSLIFDTRHQIL